MALRDKDINILHVGKRMHGLSHVKHGALLVEVDDDTTHVDVPHLVPLSSASSLSEEETDSNSLTEETGVDGHPVPASPLGPGAEKSKRNFSHSFSGLVTNIKSLMLCAPDTVCGKDDFVSYCAQDFDPNTCSTCEPPDFGKDNQSGLVPTLSEAYKKGIYCFIPKNDPPSAKDKFLYMQEEEFVYISKEEEFYVSRWNGHLPLVPMSASDAAVRRKRLLRKRALVARGLRPSEASFQSPYNSPSRFILAELND
jgi:hypothetical protein